MEGIRYLWKKIGLTYLVWLQNGNKYMILEEPAWFVFSRMAQRHNASGIALRCAERYGFSYNESLDFVHDIQSRIEQLNHPEFSNPTIKSFPEVADHIYFPYSTHYYRFGHSVIKFSFETLDFESYLHPLIAHLESFSKPDEASFFELFAFSGKLVFRLNGKVKGVWSPEETHLVKGIIFLNLVNTMFDKTDDFWLMTVHASAITNGKKTILFSAGPGSGKTTMAAMLQELGYQMVSDDFVPIDRHSFRAWPFPIAMSVKQGSMEIVSSIYPELKQKPLNTISPQKSVRYLFPRVMDDFSLQACPVKEIVFINYDPAVDFKWEKAEPEKAIRLLLDQSWISPSDGNAEILLDRLSKWSFYELTYSENQKALAIINNLFSHD